MPSGPGAVHDFLTIFLPVARHKSYISLHRKERVEPYEDAKAGVRQCLGGRCGAGGNRRRRKRRAGDRGRGRDRAGDVPIAAPRVPGLITAHATANTDCVLPDGTHVSFFHCYTPQQIRSSYGVNAVAPITVGGHTVPNRGQGQTIVLVDSYGSPTAAADLAHFHATFFPKLPAPSFKQIFPLGNPQFHNTCSSAGLSGSCAAAAWSGEATLD